MNRKPSLIKGANLQNEKVDGSPQIMCSDYITDQELDKMSKELAMSGRLYSDKLPHPGKKCNIAALNAISGLAG